MRNILRGLFLLLLSCTGLAHAADTGWLVSPQNDHARIRFQAERSQDRIYGLLYVELASGWKTYWRTPGEGGVAPKITWNNTVQDEWFWPVPSRFDISGLTTQGYHQQVIIPMILTGSSDDALAGTLTLSTCSNVCLLTDYPLHLDFSQPVGPGFQDAFESAMRAIPKKDGVTSDLAAHLAGNNLIITASTADKWEKPAAFFDEIAGGVMPGEPSYRTDGQHLTVTVPVTDEWGDRPVSLAGKTLSLVLTNGDKAQQSHVILGSDIADANAAESEDNLGRTLLFALLGGLILNLMPCVLPVMGMKLSSVLQAGSDRNKIRLRFLATSAGILTSFALLALMLTTLKLTGASLGWGIQFQNPWFIAVMVVVTFVFALNLFGAFEVWLPSWAIGRMATAGGTGLKGSFFEGVFATLLATPCSAPFLGTAVAFALAAPLHDLWLIFFMLGLGMSLPWLFVALIPKTAMLLPRPGRWMRALKIILGLMMLASSLWLATLLGGHFGERESPSSESEVSAGRIHWQPLSEEAITSALAEGKRVFVDISADWCVTCKVNEYRVLNQPEIVAALNQPDVVALRGDWSQPSEMITAFLQKRNSYAIPFNQVYGPARPSGDILPPLLDKQTLLRTLNSAIDVNRGELPHYKGR